MRHQDAVVNQDWRTPALRDLYGKPNPKIPSKLVMLASNLLSYIRTSRTEIKKNHGDRQPGPMVPGTPIKWPKIKGRTMVNNPLIKAVFVMGVHYMGVG